MKNIIAATTFALFATTASAQTDMVTWNEENGYWGYAQANHVTNSIETFNEENGYWGSENTDHITPVVSSAENNTSWNDFKVFIIRNVNSDETYDFETFNEENGYWDK